MQGLPLQRAGVLEFVDEQMAHAGIEALLHPAGQLGLGQQRECPALQVVHVDQATLALEGLELGHQHLGQAGHAGMFDGGLVLGEVGGDGLERGDGIQLGGGVAQALLGRAGLGEERRPDGREGGFVGQGQSLLDTGRRVARLHALGAAELDGQSGKAGAQQGKARQGLGHIGHAAGEHASV